MSRVPVPRLARGILIVVLAGFASIYVAAGSPLAIVVFALQLVHVLPALGRFRGLWPLGAQAVAAYAAVLWTGTSVGILGFVGGSLLLTPLWPLAPVVAVSAALLGSPDPAISMVLISLVIYGLTRLTERVADVHATRLAVAMAAVAEERLHLTAELNDGLGRGLAAIARGARQGTPEALAEVVETARRSLADARSAAAGYRATSLAPEITTARAMLGAAGVAVEVRVGHAEPLGPAGALLAVVLREAVTEVVRRRTATTCVIETFQEKGAVRLRVTNDGARTAGDENLGDLPAQVAEAGGTLTTHLTDTGRLTVDAVLPGTRPPASEPRGSGSHGPSVALLAAVLVGFSVKALLLVPSGLLVPAAACLAVIIFMQLRSVVGRHMVALSIMTVLTYAPIPLFGRAWLGIAGFLAGPVLLAFPQAVAWPLVAGVMAIVAVCAAQLGLPVAATVNYTVSTLVTGLVVHGLVRLAQLVKELQESRQALAHAAVVEERLRAARDLHDLLGHSLAAVLLKCELARRLDPDRARAELDDVLTMVAQAEADLRATVSGEHRELSLADEAKSASSLLSAAGVEVDLVLDHGPLAPEVETVLGAVLREAVTNVLRHSSARHCAIATSADEGVVRLRVRNDGLGKANGRRGSAGIGNLTVRLAALSGTLVTDRDDGWFELTAEAPTTPRALGLTA
ncbi:sensor histidine kinase [Sphaerisporangium fuscum]|uniref:sensor histidine kinase n=1 Tax=Sphaerisporangium fuscum TaxID=2835868 RepID=UPI001BDCE187|nr:histidine kinase [Sphaerisporangium fuscum]